MLQTQTKDQTGDDKHRGVWVLVDSRNGAARQACNFKDN